MWTFSLDIYEIKIFKKLAEKTAPRIAMPLSIVYTYLVKMVSSKNGKQLSVF